MHTKITKDAFKGQDIFVGMDVHKKDFTVTFIAGGMFYKTVTCPPDAKTIASYLENNFPGATYHSVYEAGFSGFWFTQRVIPIGNQFYCSESCRYTDNR